ncbi:MAG: glucose-1-phosphate adenylyltransferase [Candidatus Manganitrophus sp. SA1]|nr:glucose-1-phosphate adenylyltransferase [Candidatus Manganitrophus morganii]
MLGMVLAGGRGERLFPLTRDRSKPSVSFGGKYRIIDFVLSNFINSGIYSIYVVVQYKSQSLIEHLRAAWRLGGRIKHQFITIAPPQMRRGEVWYRGTADAVYQNLHVIRNFDPELVVVFGADHIYRMDIAQMMDYHREREADVTVAAIPVPIESAHRFGVIKVNKEGRIIGFLEKPKDPPPMPGNPKFAYASMGNYLFNRDILMEALSHDAKRHSEHDFGRTIIPELFPEGRVFAYDFSQNEIPGLKKYEERGYWRDVGSIQAYYDAHMDLLGEHPRFDLNNLEWPILSDAVNAPAARMMGGEVVDSFIGEGSIIKGAKVKRSIIGRGVVLEAGAEVEESILFDFCEVGSGCRIKRSIIDRFNLIKPGEEIGYDLEHDKQRFTVNNKGVVTIPRAPTRFFY